MGFDGAKWAKTIISALKAELGTSYCPLMNLLWRGMLVNSRESRYSARRCAKEIRHLDATQFRHSTPTPTPSSSQDYGTVLYDPLDPEAVSRDKRDASPWHDAASGAERHDRSAAPPPESYPRSASAAAAPQTTSASHASRPPDSERRPAKRRQEQPEAGADEAAYFVGRLSNPLHPLYVGSALAGGDLVSDWTDSTPRGSVATSGPPVQQTAVEPAAAGESSSVLTDWYNKP